MSIYLESDAVTTLLDLIASGRIAKAHKFLVLQQREQQDVTQAFPFAVTAARGIVGDQLRVEDDPVVIPEAGNGGVWVSCWLALMPEDMTCTTG